MGDYDHCIIPLTANEVIYVSGSKHPTNGMDVLKINIDTGAHTTLPSPRGATKGTHYCTREGSTIFVSDQISGRQHKVWKYSISEEKWTSLPDVYDSQHEVLAHVDRELTMFGRESIQVLRNGAWQKAEQQLKGQLEWSSGVGLPSGSRSCASGWRQLNQQCFYLSKKETVKSFAEGETACNKKNRKAHLAS